MTIISVDMKVTCESVPLQFEGTVDGNPAYFRARYDSWYFSIVKPGRDAVGPDRDDVLFYRDAMWGDGEFAAGYMPELTGRELIDQCVKDWRLGKSE